MTLFREKYHFGCCRQFLNFRNELLNLHDFTSRFRNELLTPQRPISKTAYFTVVLCSLRWTIRGLCCELVSGVLAREVLMRWEFVPGVRGPLKSYVLSLTVNN